MGGHWGLARAAASTAGSSNAQVSAARAQVIQVGDLHGGHWPGDLAESRPSALGSLGLAGLPCPAGLMIPARCLWSGGQVVLPDSLLPGRGVPGGQCGRGWALPWAPQLRPGKGQSPGACPVSCAFPQPLGLGPASPRGTPKVSVAALPWAPDPVQGTRMTAERAQGLRLGWPEEDAAPRGRTLALALGAGLRANTQFSLLAAACPWGAGKWCLQAALPGGSHITPSVSLASGHGRCVRAWPVCFLSTSASVMGAPAPDLIVWTQFPCPVAIVRPSAHPFLTV